MKKPNLVTGIVALTVSLAVLYGYVYVIGKSWKKSQQ